MNPGSPLPLAHVRTSAARRIHDGGLWIFSNEIADGPEDIEPGQLIRVCSPSGAELGIAAAEPHSLIAARLLARPGEPDPEGADYFRARFARAAELRAALHLGDCFRLVFSESDALPGLVVDRYGPLLAVQLTTWGMERLKEPIFTALREAFQPGAIVVRNDLQARRDQGLPTADDYQVFDASIDPANLEVRMADFKLVVDFTGAQKTGLFLDQAATYAAVDRFDFEGRAGADLFCYSGLFGMVALRHGAAQVTFVDSSEGALAALELNLARNGVPRQRYRVVKADVLSYLPEVPRASLDFLFVDPPKFIVSKRLYHRGMQGYYRLNKAAAEALADGGLLFTFSCSHHAGEAVLRGKIVDAIRKSGATASELGRYSQNADHPVNIAMPESRYLKGFLFRIERRLVAEERDEE